MVQTDQQNPEKTAPTPDPTGPVPGTPDSAPAADIPRRGSRPVSIIAGWDRQERIALLLLVAVTLAVLAGHLILSSVGKAPFAHPYSNASHEGELVLFQGVVGRVTHTQTGGHLILEVEGHTIFVPASAARGHTFRIGDFISLYGTVQTYRGEREIVIQDGVDIWIDPDHS